MAKVQGPLFSMMVSGAFGEIVFDKRGFVRRKGLYHDPKTSRQGNYRQALTAAQRCAQVCGPQTRQHLRQAADQASRWSAFLTKTLLGPERARYHELAEIYRNGVVDQPPWEAAAREIGLKQVGLAYAAEAPISPGRQLFMLASTLYELAIYRDLGNPLEHELPGSNVEAWQQQILA